MARVFLSHRAADAAIATVVQESIQQYCGITVFRSSDPISIPGGKKWRREIESALDDAEWLVLLYSGSNQRWDWCMYEVGFFVATVKEEQKKSMEEHQRVAVLHPCGKVPPSPIDDVQSFPAEVSRVSRMLSDIREEEEDKLSDERKAERAKFASAIVEAVTRLGGYNVDALPTFACNIACLSREDRWVPENDPNDVIVHQDNWPHGIQSGNYEWTDFTKKCGAFPHDQVLRLVEALLNRELPSFRIEAYEIESVSYRPVIIEAEITEVQTGHKRCRLKIGISKGPRHMIASQSNRMDRALALMELCLRFRATIVERYLDELHEFILDGNKFSEHADTAKLEARKLIGRIVFDMNEFRTTASYLGFKSQSDILDIVVSDERQRDMWLEDIKNFAIYRNAIEDLQKDTSDIEGVRLVRRVMDDFQWIRKINLTFLQAASGTLAGIASTLRVPNLERDSAP